MLTGCASVVSIPSADTKNVVRVASNFVKETIIADIEYCESQHKAGKLSDDLYSICLEIIKDNARIMIELIEEEDKLFNKSITTSLPPADYSGIDIRMPTYIVPLGGGSYMMY